MDMRNEAHHIARQDIARQAAAQKASAEFLTFRLGGEEYGIDILRVQEIRSYEEPTRIANSPSFIKGVVNLELHPDGILVRNAEKPRAGWDEAFRLMAENDDDERALGEVPTNFERKDWQW